MSGCDGICDTKVRVRGGPAGTEGGRQPVRHMNTNTLQKDATTGVL